MPRAGSGITFGDVEYLRDRKLMVPVDGVSPDRVPDTFYAKRDGSRIHRATDIMAARGTPVIAADDGRVLKLRSNENGGITIYAVDPKGRFVYYYAHLDHYRDGLREGEPVEKGELLGYVGTTGNAPANAPHLHFQIMRLRATDRWWDGVPIDPLPYLAKAGHRR